jgi:murein DD-endopeptidase MepM/ murein hydrolase activator NlpD
MVVHSSARRIGWILPVLCFACGAFAQPFQFPTANHALLEPGGGEKFLAGTAGKSWESGGFGCVRSEGWQMHEGLDIRALQRDKHGEPTDPVMATADGVVAYVNARPALSNYGKYIVVKHRIEGLEIYSLYAHLSEIRDGIKPGRPVKGGETIAIMGRTSNTRETITRDRAHVHFELNLFVNDRFSAWYKKIFPTERNDHAEWNGENLFGLDPRAILLAERDQGARFSMLDFVRHQTELFRVVVRKTDFPWLKRYAALVRPNPVAEKEGIAGYELAINFNGIVFDLVPRAASEIKGKAKYQILSVNDTEAHKNPCRRYIIQRGSRWELTTRGTNLLDLITF